MLTVLPVTLLTIQSSKPSPISATSKSHLSGYRILASSRNLSENMAGTLNLPSTMLIRQPPSTKTPKTSISIRATSRPSETSSISTSAGTKQDQNLGSSTSSFSPPPNFKPPEPKRFGVRPDKIVDVLGASLSLIFRLGTGVFVSGYSASLVPKNEFPPNQYALEIAGYKVKETSKIGPRPEKPIEIYEFESCPFCRKVREIVAILDLDILFYPCPRNGPNFRPKVAQMGGKQQFPYMVDPNTGVSMYESDDIISIWFRNMTLTEGFAMIGRLGKGSIYKPSKQPPLPLEIWAYEGSPFCKLVREVLVELELQHLVHCCARGSPKRQKLYEKVGHFQVPYLEDPNTGVQMFESAEIVEYLQATYAL